MRWAIFHIPERNIIHIDAEGKLTAGVPNQMVKEPIEAGKFQTSGLFLADHRKTLVAMSFLDIFERPKELDSLGFPRNSRIARVFPETALETLQLLETVTQNIRYQIHIFKAFNCQRNG